MTGVDRKVADLDGPAALPRKNGELVFAAPWEGRAFGMAVALSQAGRYDWDEFRQQLIRHVGEHAYYESWLDAFESLLDSKGLISSAELHARTAEFLSGARDDVF